MKPGIAGLGRWPALGSELRQAKQLTPIKPEDQLPLIHGKERHVLFSFVVSNDYMHLAVLTVPVSGLSELESHKGDEILAVLKGTLVVRVPADNDNPKDATYASYQIKEGEKFFIPEGVRHQYMNFTNEEVKVYVAIGPGL